MSRVDIHGDGIELASKNGIIIHSGAGIDIKSSDDESVSAIQIDKDKGIYLGASHGIKLYSGSAINTFYGPYHGAAFHKDDIWVKIPIQYDSNNNNTAYSNINNNGEQIS